MASCLTARSGSHEQTANGHSYQLSQPQTTFAAVQTWQAIQGQHTIAVHAVSTGNRVVASQDITVNTMPAVALVPTPPAPTLPTATAVISVVPTATAVISLVPTATATMVLEPSPLPTQVPPQPTAVACSDDAAFVADLTVPNGTAMFPGQMYDKVWRVANTGSCTWSRILDGVRRRRDYGRSSGCYRPGDGAGGDCRFAGDDAGTPIPGPPHWILADALPRGEISGRDPEHLGQCRRPRAAGRVQWDPDHRVFYGVGDQYHRGQLGDAELGFGRQR